MIFFRFAIYRVVFSGIEKDRRERGGRRRTRYNYRFRPRELLLLRNFCDFWKRAPAAAVLRQKSERVFLSFLKCRLLSFCFCALCENEKGAHACIIRYSSGYIIIIFSPIFSILRVTYVFFFSFLSSRIITIRLCYECILV